MNSFHWQDKSHMPAAGDLLPGREEAMPITNEHFVNGHPLRPPFPAGMQTVCFGLGCFWGAERRFWQQPGIYTTAVGYAGGTTPNPTYQEVCSGRTGHAEVVLVVFDLHEAPIDGLLKLFWESHDPTQGMRQGNDTGTQYRSCILTTAAEQARRAETSRQAYQQALKQARLGIITTEIRPLTAFYYAEDYHQQYLAKNPQGYCALGGAGVLWPGLDAGPE